MKRLIRVFKRYKKSILLAVLGCMIALGGFIYFWVFYDLPAIDNIQQGMVLPATRIYDRNGVLLYEIRPPGNDQGLNTVVPLETIPQYCVNAFIATEDENFYQHPGVDIEGIIRALWINLRGGEVLAGGSTITQQTARLLLMDPQQRLNRSLQRKLREMVLAIRLQNRYSKDEVLTLYLNQVYFGNMAYGIEGAARTYFAKSAAELSLAECALLAGLVQNPAYYDPFTNLGTAEDRQDIVLGRMVDEGYITQAQAQAAAHDELQFAATRFPINAPHAVMAVWQQLERDYPEYVYGGGLEVITTIDLNWQNAAQRIVQAQLDRINHPADGSRAPANANNAALVAIDPNTGQILTMLGSPDYFDESIDGAMNAAVALRQPGSTLKPFTYAAAMNPQLDHPYTAASMLLDIETPFITRRLESYVPSNYGLVEHGPVSLRESLASSYNIPVVSVLNDIGIERMVALASNAGLTSLANNAQVDLSITLGGGEVSLYNLVQAYSIFPNGGYYIEPSLILKISTASGETLYEWTPPPLDQQILDERIAFIITDILSDDAARIPGFGRNSVLNIGRPAAAKTGTTTDFRDNWVVGYTPNLVVGVWVGNADNTPMVDVSGISGAGPIWNQFMRTVLLGQPELEFEQPDGLIRLDVCALSGLLPTPACPLLRTEYFIPGTQPTEPDNIYQVFQIDRRTGLLADETTPQSDIVEQVFIVLPEEASEWGIRHGIRQPPTGASVLLSHTELRLLQPDPYTIFQISPLIPIDAQRIRFRAAVPPGTQSLTFTLFDETGESVVQQTITQEPWAMWWQLKTGAYSLQATATLDDGAVQTTDALYFAVTEYEEPASYTVESKP
ncbi:MAG: PBP1A family penicillin-binding protein [Chloroflexi bacterium]|nr:MAG: PBP1A family penicillin-binding protein [Chloroflexota bacterium]